MTRNPQTLTGPIALTALLWIVSAAIQAPGRQAAQTTFDRSQPIPYFIADGAGQAGYRPSDRELARWAFEAWQRTAAKGLRFEPASEATALIRLYWIEPNAGTYGETRPLVVGARTGAEVFIQPEVSSLGEDIAARARADTLLRETIVYLTCLHEIGHALGLKHTHEFRDIMYYFGYGGDVLEYFERYRSQIHSRGDIASVSGLSATDAARVRSLYAAR